jgi:hypothetical protein
MPARFVELPPSGRYWLRDGRVPTTLLAEPVPGLVADGEGLARADLEIVGAVVARIAPAGTAPADAAGVPLDGGQVWPCFVDLHTHLDKGHTWQRAPNPDGTFASAIRTVAADRAARWTAEDVSRRMDFGLRCSFAHGTRAIRTHLDSLGPQAAISWPAMRALRQRWAGRVELQAASIVPVEIFTSPDGERLADLVADAGGILGGVTYMSPASTSTWTKAVTPARGRSRTSRAPRSGTASRPPSSAVTAAAWRCSHPRWWRRRSTWSSRPASRSSRCRCATCISRAASRDGLRAGVA